MSSATIEKKEELVQGKWVCTPMTVWKVTITTGKAVSELFKFAFFLQFLALAMADDLFLGACVQDKEKANQFMWASQVVDEDEMSMKVADYMDQATTRVALAVAERFRGPEELLEFVNEWTVRLDVIVEECSDMPEELEKISVQRGHPLVLQAPPEELAQQMENMKVIEKKE